jgi:putative PIN family toxin of toxin-antitoxin system
MRVVLDTNVWVSGLFFGGVAREVLDRVSEGEAVPCFTPATFSELTRLLMHEKFSAQRERLSFSVADFFAWIAAMHSHVSSSACGIPRTHRGRSCGQ